MKNSIITIIFTAMITTNTTLQPCNAQNPAWLKMVEYAAKAPSGHNTQPWIFVLKSDAIEIHPDFGQALPVVDGSNRELYISLGCAAENLQLAAAEAGYRSVCSIKRDALKGDAYIRVNLEKGETTRNELFKQIDKRQTNRSVYKGSDLPEDTLQQMKDLAVDSGVALYFFSRESEDFKILRGYVALGNEMQMEDEAFKNELIAWIRFNKWQKNSLNNGLTYEVMGTPALPSFLGKPIVKSQLTPKKQNKADMEKIDSSSQLVLFTVKENNPEQWVRVGMTLQRFLLEATRLGIANAYLNQPCEVSELTHKMQEDLQIKDEYAVLLLRLGYADPLPYSPRKAVEEVVFIMEE
jgi:nitroreductase